MKKKDSVVVAATTTILVTCIVMFMSCFFFVFETDLLSNSTSRITASSNPMLQEHFVVGSKISSISEQDQVQPLPLQHPQPSPISCNRSHASYDICLINGSTVLDPIVSTFYAMKVNSPPVVEKLRPYPRKLENGTMARIKEITITSTPKILKCEFQHNAPALVFSVGGHTGNFFHEFNDGFIPLFVTIHSIFPNQDVVLVIVNARDWWVNKYKDLIGVFSKYPIITLENDTSTHCFPSASVGLVSHGFMTIEPKLIPTKKTFTHFHALLDKAYGHIIPSIPIPKMSRPRLVLVSRGPKNGRAILNQLETKAIAEDVGFDVIEFKPSIKTSLRESYRLINSSHVMIGVHGAGLTHFMFMRSGSIFVQIVPVGTEWVSKVCFGNPARVMGLEYMEYRIEVEESSLVEKYGKENIVVKDPRTLQSKGWSSEIMDIYLKEQNVMLNLVRFRIYLEKAYEKAKKLMDMEG